MTMRDKVRGCFLGSAVGDALGKPVEILSDEQIATRFGRIDKYITNSTHKWFAESAKGTTTDDWQLTKAVARSFISAGDFDLDALAQEHVKEYAISTAGWGGSTRESIARMAKGMHWSEAGYTEATNRGFGNGISMKVAPIGLWMGLTNQDKQNIHFLKKMVDFAAMTHPTSIGVTSGLAHAFAVQECFVGSSVETILKSLKLAADIGKYYKSDTLKDNLGDRFAKLHNNWQPIPLSSKQIIAEFGAGSCYVYDSLPFTYAFFLRNPNSIESMFDCVSAGGDADSNASMLGAMLGALHGTKIFPDRLVDELADLDEVVAVADAFYDKFAKE